MHELFLKDFSMVYFFTEVASIIKTLLQKLLIRCGMEGAWSPSPRGCYELTVPDSLKKKVQARQSIKGKIKK